MARSESERRDKRQKHSDRSLEECFRPLFLLCFESAVIRVFKSVKRYALRRYALLLSGIQSMFLKYGLDCILPLGCHPEGGEGRLEGSTSLIFTLKK
jgi:hypothetical protein